MNKLIQKIMGGRCEMHAARQRIAVANRVQSLVSYNRYLTDPVVVPYCADRTATLRKFIATRMYGV